MGIPLALALMTAGPHFYNQACKHNKHPLDLEQLVLLGRASHKARSLEQLTKLWKPVGIVSNTESAHVDSWIFAHRNARGGADSTAATC